jgi:hypothetical protein
MQDNSAGRMELARLLGKHTQLATTDMRRNPFDMNYIYYVRKAGDFFLCLPADNHMGYKFLEGIPGLEEYRYWNNTDIPKGMSKEDWDARGVFWDEHWDPESASVQIAALSIMDPGLEILRIMMPEIGNKAVETGYWESP